MKIEDILLFSTAGFLAACSGSSTLSGDSGLITAPPPLSTILPDQPTPVTNMPTGTFSYLGFTVFSFPNSPDATDTANVALDANFSSNTMEGTINGFATRDGSISLLNGEIAGNEFSADVAGNVSYLGGPLIAEGTMAGVFLGPDAVGIRAAIDGTLGGDAMLGVVAATRQ